MSEENALSSSRPVGSLTVHRQSAQTGAFAFIPLPFVDDWLITRERKSLVRKILNNRQISHEEDAAEILAEGNSVGFFKKIGGMAKGLVMKPLKKLFRSFLFWLTVRRAVLTFAATYFLARFLMKEEVLASGSKLDKDEAKRLAKIFHQVVSNLDRRLAKESVRHLWEFMRQSKKADQDNVPEESVGEAIEKEAPGILADFDRRVTAALAAN
ncbi:hypothetical protein [Roseibacillus ishigakijimensis]|uniref:Uncharacterized protein n=1 Tax=Roseibacillus ishigakijimensis TaxID=454146 RepID=A0A934RKY2_9BACT|nr:hypothetical protein [Roseibacillus ishigakijimensis]MBK1832645.1 hypothetical protein [Roseibacillus ishigakijimensis]